MWKTEVYLGRKQRRTRRADRREIIPQCIILVGTFASMSFVLQITVFCYRKYDVDIPVQMDNTLIINLYLMPIKTYFCKHVLCIANYGILLQEVRRRYPSTDGQYTDYKSIFDAN